MITLNEDLFSFYVYDRNYSFLSRSMPFHRFFFFHLRSENFEQGFIFILLVFFVMMLRYTKENLTFSDQVYEGIIQVHATTEL